MRIDHGLWRQPFFGVLAANLSHGCGGHLLHLRCSDAKSIGFLHGLFVSIALVGGQCLDTAFVGAGYGRLHLLDGPDLRVGTVQLVADVALGQRIVDPAVMQPLTIALLLIGASVGGEYVIGMLACPDHFIRNSSVLRPALGGVGLLILLGKGRRASGGVEGHDALCGFIKLRSLGGVGNFDRGVLDAMFEDLMDDLASPFAGFRIALPGAWQCAGCIAGVAGDAEGIDRLIRLGQPQPDGPA